MHVKTYIKPFQSQDKLRFLDAETFESFVVLSLMVQDDLETHTDVLGSDEGHITVIINDLNDMAPVKGPNELIFTIPEDHPLNTAVESVRITGVTDDDVTADNR